MTMKKYSSHPERRSTLTRQQRRRARCLYTAAVLVLSLCAVLTVPAFAAGTDPLAIVNNLSDFSAPVSGR